MGDTNTNINTNAIAVCPWCKVPLPSWHEGKVHVKYCDKAPRPRGRKRPAKLSTVEELYGTGRS